MGEKRIQENERVRAKCTEEFDDWICEKDLFSFDHYSGQGSTIPHSYGFTFDNTHENEC